MSVNVCTWHHTALVLLCLPLVLCVLIFKTFYAPKTWIPFQDVTFPLVSVFSARISAPRAYIIIYSIDTEIFIILDPLQNPSVYAGSGWLGGQGWGVGEGRGNVWVWKKGDKGEKGKKGGGVKQRGWEQRENIWCVETKRGWQGDKYRRKKIDELI